MKKIISIASIITLSVIFSCKKEYDSPPKKEIPIGMVITVDSLRNLFQGTSIHFNQDYSVYGVITADETSGNLYKNVFMQDATGAINLRLLTSGGVYQGDSIRLYLRNCVLSKYNGMLQIDSVNTDNNIIKQSTGKVVVPQTVTLSQINSSLQSRLIKIDSVEFIPTDAGTTYADAVNQQSMNKTIEDCSGNTILMRNSGYANFAGNATPTGKGSVIAVVGEYNGTMQLYIRNTNDVQMPGPRCPGSVIPYLSKDFEDNSLTSGGWHTEQVTGLNINWTTATFGSTFAKCSNFISPTNYACETWYISPSINLSASISPNLYFDNAYKYTGAGLQLMISTDYSGSGNPNTATWTNLTTSAIWSAGNYVFVNSGAVSMNAFKTTGVYIAFKYTGSASDGSTWEIDNVLVKEN
jgi:hypothetical protein